MQSEFSLIHFRDITTSLASSEDAFNLSLVLSMFDEITKLFRLIQQNILFLDCLGSAMSFATSDVTQKLNHVQKRTQEMIDNGIY